MKKIISILIYLLLTSSCSKELDSFEEIEKNPYIESYIVDKNDSHLGFPSILGNANGKKLIIAYREGSEHNSFDGRIMQKESYDKGKTWINKKEIYTPEAGHDARDPQYLALPNGNIICRFFIRASKTSSTIKVIQSNDFGDTYTNSSGNYPMPFESETFIAARGNMLIIHDTLYSTAYNRWNECWLSKSFDKGESWKFTSWIDKSDRKDTGEYYELNESSLCYEDNIIYLVARSGFSTPKKLHITKSLDWGKTWDKMGELNVYGQAPSLTPYKEGHILTYRNINTSENKDGHYQFECTLLKNGEIYSSPVILLKNKNYDFGYGDIFTLDKYFLVCCYINNSIHCLRIEYEIFGI